MNRIRQWWHDLYKPTVVLCLVAFATLLAFIWAFFTFYGNTTY